MSQLGLILQESLRPQREARTILGLLTEQMDGVDLGTSRRRSLKERFRFIGMGCCGATWVFRPIIRHEREREATEQVQDPNPVEPECVNPGSSGSGMNLATALAAERQMRGSEEASGGEGGTPWRVSLMKLLEEKEVENESTTVEGNDTVCCVCMGRKKGAAFIPCGHTFCRVCSRELWLNRGNCPLCNRSILEILDIF
ncbi:RING/U-box domain-containing protein [Trifolium pratense]|uniref:RING/U-box domain-containing protein n=1 Tax=Trifolium pratense TaxID=57577 RepID=A0A2K3JT98_TRIPR|nr:RING/U-box domain-containing protein [Trifolium pratense]